MSSPTTPPTDSDRRLAEVVQEGHETRDVNARAVLWFGLIVVVGTAAVSLLLLLLLRHYSERARRSDPQLPPLAEVPLQPSGPLLQSAPIADYETFHAEQEELLTGYGWVNRKQGVVRIPVERAMEIVLERGLPSPGGPATADDASPFPTQPPDAAQPPDPPSSPPQPE